MDIKGIARNVIPLPSVRKSEDSKAKSAVDADNERDGNGQASNGENQKRRHLNPEEILEAVKYLEGLAGVKDNNLRVRFETKDSITIVYIEDRDGKVVRRIPEAELSLLTCNRQRQSGHLLNKAL
jgi:uncharacterized FlaG/YvyC family protein